MRAFCRFGFMGAALLLFTLTASARASVYQWSVAVTRAAGAKENEPSRAYLWIPPNCQTVRAVVIADQNMEEEQLFQDDDFRKNLVDLGFALIWIAPAMGDIDFRFDRGDGEVLEQLLKDLAEQSGYTEIANAPLVPAGHSATASWGFDIAAWKPDRVLAVLSLSGTWPYYGSENWRQGHSVDSVPALTTKGEYEVQGSLVKGWYAGLKGNYFNDHPANTFTQVVEPGDGHFSASKQKIQLINLYLRKAAQYRLPTSGSELKSIDGKKDGWLYEVWQLNKSPSAPAAPVGKFKGSRDRAFWAFDGEMAKAIEKFQAPPKGTTPVLPAYRQQAGLAAPTSDHAMVHLKFEPKDDGLTFTLSGAFWDHVPATKDGKSAEWQNFLGEDVRTFAQGDPLPNPPGGIKQMTIEPICGPVKQLSKDTFAIRFNRIGLDDPRRSNDIWFELTYPGDAKYKRAVQQAELQFPRVNKRGTAQEIKFLDVPDQPSETASAIQLNATSSAGAPVHFYIRQGPAEVDDQGKVTLTPIPPKSKLPIAVTVVAWQWGRSIAPFMQTATPVEHTFQILAR